MELWFKTYREKSGDILSPLVFDFRTDYELNPLSPLEEANRAVLKIVEAHPGPYTLLASGGVDSQTMIYAWHISGVPFRVVHYSYGDNEEDTRSLLAFCQTVNVPVLVNSFDVDEFINSKKYKEMAIKYECASPHILTYIAFTSLHEETCIMGGNFTDEVQPSLNWVILGLDRFRSLAKSNFVPFFLNCTPELGYSFLPKLLSIRKCGNTYDNAGFTQSSKSYAQKCDAYVESGIPVIRQSQKLTGFENIKARYDTACVPTQTRLKWSSRPSRRPFDLLYRYSLYDDIGAEYSESARLIHNNFWVRINKYDV